MSDHTGTTRRDFLKFTVTFAAASSLPPTARPATGPELGQGKLTILTASGFVMVTIPIIIRERGPYFIRGDGSGTVHTSGTPCIARCEIDGYPALYVPVCRFPCPNALVVDVERWMEGDTFFLHQFTLTDERR